MEPEQEIDPATGKPILSLNDVFAEFDHPLGDEARDVSRKIGDAMHGLILGDIEASGATEVRLKPRYEQEPGGQWKCVLADDRLPHFPQIVTYGDTQGSALRQAVEAVEKIQGMTDSQVLGTQYRREVLDRMRRRRRRR